ncbi:hypothetical protein EW145_g4742 [Phellinidium pouzarii]|uniref:Uncharacterized protein n=1 Tax=Phellinidium pouzarii TaxID=167371 RepID=A0A4S4L2H3_9AGAM|nr:hypothetical protein EW145_g4742 [Phellinidium pouzarii]
MFLSFMMLPEYSFLEMLFLTLSSVIMSELQPLIPPRYDPATYVLRSISYVCSAFDLAYPCIVAAAVSTRNVLSSIEAPQMDLIALHLERYVDTVVTSAHLAVDTLSHRFLIIDTPETASTAGRSWADSLRSPLPAICVWPLHAHLG